MNDISQAVINSLPWKKKNTPSGWISFNAVCCHHNGQRQDTRSRGGVLLTPEGGISHHCFNCGFTASWRPGRRINFKMRRLMGWLGIADEEIRKLSLFALSRLDSKVEIKQENLKELPAYEPREPCPGKSIVEWIADYHSIKNIPNNLKLAIEYLDSRGLGNRLDQFYWTDDLSLSNRVLVPFTWLNKPMGYCGRIISPNTKRTKYLSNYPSNMIWGYDLQDSHAKFCIVAEGLLDAVSIDGLALCNNEPNDQQATVIDSLDREVIVVPDRDSAGKKLIEKAMDYGWNVAFPDWQPHVKDISQAVELYGQLFTMKTILNSVETSNLKIQLMTKKWIRS